MGKRPTRTDVARLAGVSVATVSYVVNEGPRPVADATRQRVLAAINELDYHPLSTARSLSTGYTHIIGVLVPSLVASYFGHLVTELEIQLGERGYSMFLASSQEDQERENHMLTVLADHAIDGLLFTPVSNRNSGVVEKLINDGISVVSLDRCAPGVPADVVMTDNIQAAKQATSFLIDSGCRNILCTSFHETASSAIDRVEGYREALEAAGLPIEEKMILKSLWPFGESIEPTLNHHIDLCGIPDGILCTVEGSLNGVINVLRQRGISVPDQVQVAGGFTASVSPWHQLLEKPIPIIRQDYQLIAKRAVELLMDRLDGDVSDPKVELIKAEFIV